MLEKGEVSESKYSCDPTAGASPDPIFLLPERSVKTEVRKDSAPRHCPRSPLAAPRSLKPLSPEKRSWKDSGAPQLAPDRFAQTGKQVRAQGTAAAEPTRASNQEGRALRPSVPPPTGGRATACALAACGLRGEIEGNPDPHFAEPWLSSASARFPAAERPRAVAPQTYIVAVRSAQQLQQCQEREQRTQRDPEHDRATMGSLRSAVGALASRSTSGGC